MLLAYRNQRQQMFIASADAWNGEYKTIAKNICPQAHLEDPDLTFRDGLYHLVAEDGKGTLTGHERFGAELVSKDGVHWETNDPVTAYTHTIRWTDGTETEVDRRERPEFFNANCRRGPQGHGPADPPDKRRAGGRVTPGATWFRWPQRVPPVPEVA